MVGRLQLAPRRGRRLRALGAAAALAGALAACGAGRPEPVVASPAQPDATTEWEATLDSVHTLVAADRHASADSLLDRFAVRNLGTPVGAEATFWRALLALDPGNSASDPRAALVAIDGYLAGGIHQPRYAEALVLRRTASALERARNAPIPTLTVTTLPADSSLARLRAAQDSIRALRTELERTQAELERIRRRIRP